MMENVCNPGLSSTADLENQHTDRSWNTGLLWFKKKKEGQNQTFLPIIWPISWNPFTAEVKINNLNRLFLAYFWFHLAAQATFGWVSVAAEGSQCSKVSGEWYKNISKVFNIPRNKVKMVIVNWQRGIKRKCNCSSPKQHPTYILAQWRYHDFTAVCHQLQLGT